LGALLQIASRLEHSSIINALTSTGWTAALIAIVHYYSMFVLVGSMTVVDLSVLGWIGGETTATTIARRVLPWVWIILPVNLFSGFILFAAAADDYLPAWPFQLKMLVVLVAIVLSIAVQVKVSTEQPGGMPAYVKALAVLSILFWIGAILMGAEVPVLSGIG
jgi:uncharacterized protein DUF6644